MELVVEALMLALLFRRPTCCSTSLLLWRDSFDEVFVRNQSAAAMDKPVDHASSFIDELGTVVGLVCGEMNSEANYIELLKLSVRLHYVQSSSSGAISHRDTRMRHLWERRSL